MDIKEVVLENKWALTIRDTCTFAELSDRFRDNFTEIVVFMKKNSIKPAGHFYGLYHSFSDEKVDFDAGISVEGNIQPEGRINMSETHGGKAVMTVFAGHYDDLNKAWKKFADVVDAAGYKLAGPCFEVYITGPAEEPDSTKWITELYTPVK